MVPPHFSMIWSEDIPQIRHVDVDGKTTNIELIAGSLGDRKAPAPAPDSWAADASNDVAIWTIEMEPGAAWKIPPASGQVHRTIYFYSGEQLHVNGDTIDSGHLIQVKPAFELLITNGAQVGNILMLQGKPINEPVAQYGPFVMNTQSEIQEAFTDFQKTQFGGWPWPKNDQVHDRDRGRFALHADGSLEEKE